MRSSTSPGSSRGTSTCSIRTSSRPWRTAAFIRAVTPHLAPAGASTTLSVPGPGSHGERERLRSPAPSAGGGSPAPAPAPCGRRRGRRLAAAPRSTSCRRSGCPSRRWSGGPGRPRPSPRATSRRTTGYALPAGSRRAPGAKAARPVAATRVQSAPRPSVRARTSAGTSPAASSATARPEREGEARGARRGDRRPPPRPPPSARAASAAGRSAPGPRRAPTPPSTTPALRTAFRQVLTGSTKAASSGRTPSGIGERAALDDPVEGQDVLRVAAARGLESGRRAVLLVEGALGVEPFARSRSRSRTARGGARRRAGPRGSPSSPGRARPRCPRSRGRRPAARAAGPSRSS